MPFSFGSVGIFGRLFTFLIFSDPSGRVGKFFPGRGDAEKLVDLWGKKIKLIPPQKRFLEQKQKKRYFIIFCIFSVLSSTDRKETKDSNSPDLSGRLPISRPLSWSPDFTTILPINEIVTYHFLGFCSFVEIF